MPILLTTMPASSGAKLGILLVATIAAAGCQSVGTDPVRSLAGSWAWHAGDDARFADPAYDDSAWERLQVPGSWGRQGHDDVFGIAWYRLKVHVPPVPKGQLLGVTIGRVNAAYELFVDGVNVGGVGQLPPNPVQEYDRHATYPLAPSESRSEITLALRVWRPPDRHPGESGPNGGPFEIGPLPVLLERAKTAEVDRLVLVCVFAVAAVYVFGLWLLRPASSEFAWFAVMAVVCGGYSFLLTQWKYVLWSDFIVMKKTEHLLLYLAPPAVIEFLWAFLRRRVPLWLRAAQAMFIAGGVAVVLVPGLTFALFLLPYLELVALGTAVVCLAYLAYWAWRGDRNATVVGVGLLALTLAMLHDAAVDRVVTVGPRIAAYGFAVMVIGMALSLATRFHRAVEGLDTLSRELEGRVQQRTTELADAYRRMEELALRDALTNLLNRRAIEQRAVAGLAHSRRRTLPYSLALIDVDHFKRINDTYGHATGDRVIVAVAQALSGVVRVSDDVARWGGEEFLVLLPDSDGQAALAAAERMRAAVERVPLVDDDGRTIHATISVGVASTATAELPNQFEELTRLADAALYAAKQAGRNRVAGP